MGDRLKGLVSGYLEKLENRGGKKHSKPVPFSMRLGERDHARLVWLAGRLDVPKTRLAEEMVRAAVEEAVEQYAAWAAPEDPEKFLEEALAEAEALPEEHGARLKPGPGPQGRKSHEKHSKPPKPER